MAMAYVNESFAFLAEDRPREAESCARKALEIVPGDRRANLMLGWSLRAQLQYSKEALLILENAAHEYPEAHLAAADVLIHDDRLRRRGKRSRLILAPGATIKNPWLRLGFGC